MSLRRKIVTKLLLGVVLVLLAGIGSYIVHQLIASRNPENALPEVYIEYNHVPLPSDHWMIDSYSWRFLLSAANWVDEDRDAWRAMEAAPVLPNTPLNIHFSPECKNMKLSRTDADGDVFSEVAGALETPSQPGVYTYTIEADWGAQGSILYYFKISVQPG